MEIIKITSLGCSSCIIMNNIFNEYKKNKNISLKEYDYDFDEEEVLKYNVGKILPVFIIKNDLKEIRIIGEKSKEEFLNILNNFESGE